MKIDYTIKYFERKTISIIVERDRSVVVRASHHVSKEVIEKEVNKRRHCYQKK